MIDIGAIFRGEHSLADIAADLTIGDLRSQTNEMIDVMRAATDGIVDADVTFVPSDPAARDDAAATADETNIAWTLGHIIVHATASSEEAAAIALSLARGVAVNERSRYEVPWETVTTAAQVVHRLEESRRMRLAMLDAWPDEPHLDQTQNPIPRLGPLNAISRFLLGLGHDAAHIEQIHDAVRQAKAARS